MHSVGRPKTAAENVRGLNVGKGGMKGRSGLGVNDLGFVINVQSRGNKCHISKKAKAASHLCMKGAHGCMASFVGSFLSTKMLQVVC